MVGIGALWLPILLSGVFVFIGAEPRTAWLADEIALDDRGFIVTGGFGVGDTISEAEVGRRYAIRSGVPHGRIIVERAGISTEQSMRTVARLMEGRNMSSAVMVSDPFHMLRLRIVARRFGIRSYSSPTRTSPIRDGSEAGWRHLVRESLILPFVVLGLA